LREIPPCTRGARDGENIQVFNGGSNQGVATIFGRRERADRGVEKKGTEGLFFNPSVPFFPLDIESRGAGQWIVGLGGGTAALVLRSNRRTGDRGVQQRNSQQFVYLSRHDRPPAGHLTLLITGGFQVPSRIASFPQ
jgi:hypothetical protein